MSITIELESNVEIRVKNQASNVGEKVEVYLKTLIDDETAKRERIGNLSDKFFAEILAPIHKEFEEGGMSEEELTEFLGQMREEVWQEQRRAK